MGGTNSNMSQLTQRDSFSGTNPLSFQPLAPYNVPSAHPEAVSEGFNKAANSIAGAVSQVALSKLGGKNDMSANKSMLEQASADTDARIAQTGYTPQINKISDRPVPVPADTSSTDIDWLKKLIGYNN